ncbi:uncharacterized protein [Asterias amurensis]|uniref:uncharacterized protein n=1 Tax=Asterias amurensis TaxID=7602 RepID=UPI003AB1E7EF
MGAPIFGRPVSSDSAQMGVEDLWICGLWTLTLESSLESSPDSESHPSYHPFPFKMLCDLVDVVLVEFPFQVHWDWSHECERLDSKDELGNGRHQPQKPNVTCMEKDCVKSSQMTPHHILKINSSVATLRTATKKTTDNLIELITLEMTLRLIYTLWTLCHPLKTDCVSSSSMTLRYKFKRRRNAGTSWRPAL